MNRIRRGTQMRPMRPHWIHETQRAGNPRYGFGSQPVGPYLLDPVSFVMSRHMLINIATLAERQPIDH